MSQKRGNADNIQSDYKVAIEELLEKYNDRLVTGLDGNNKTSLRHIGYFLKELKLIVTELKQEVKAKRLEN